MKRIKKSKRKICNFFKFTSVVAGVLSLALLISGAAMSYALPGSYQGIDNSALSQSKLPVNIRINYSQNRPTNAEIVLLDAIPIKNVTVNFASYKKVIPCGTPFGVKMHCCGAVVVDIQEIKTDNGTVCPAEKAGIKKGDIIKEADGKPVNSNNDLISIVEASNGKEINIKLLRGDKEMIVKITPAATAGSGTYRIGTWIRDSSAGIGTITFYDPSTGAFGALGHGVCDIDTGALMPLKEGTPVNATIDSIVKSVKGTAGCLQGHFSNDIDGGTITANTDQGLYGFMNSPPISADAIDVATPNEVKIGKAQILSTTNGNTPKLYDIEIEAINYDSSVKSKNLVIKVTDNTLLDTTGGIVQGMSGSPIIQNNKLVGAVTHVFVNDPQKGYGILAQNMLENTDSLKEGFNLAKAG